MIFKKPLLAISLSLFSFCFIGKSQELEFYGENITFEISDSVFRVTGIYYLCNTGNERIKQVLYYPVPLDSLYYDNVNFSGIENKDSIINIIRRDKGGIYFGIEIEPFKATEYKISYQQKLLKNRAEYILNTTKKWKRPFISANYKLIISDNIKITGISYKPDSILTENDNLIYLWHKKDFMPDRNMIIEFEHK